MAKLYFRYGAVGSAKTLNLLAVAHNYKQQNKKVVLLKPEMDTRFGAVKIKSRAGLEQEADYMVGPETILEGEKFRECHCVLVDEAQFLSESMIDQLRNLATVQNIPVICYGLRTDFKSQLFPGAKRLMEVCDAIEEIKTTCAFCNRKAVFNLKFVDGTAVFDGPTVELGCEEKYQPACPVCYHQHKTVTTI